MPTIDVRGATIAYTDTLAPAGRPDASTIVFGHGLLFSGWVFHRQIAALRASYRCVALDWRGQGDTPATVDGYDMDTLTGDAVALIRALGVGPVHWVGLSMGGFIGQRVAARHGELLRSLTLLDTSSGPEEPGKVGEYKQLAWLLRLFGIKPILSKVSPQMFGPVFLADPASKTLRDEWVRRLNRSDRAAVRKAVLGVADRPPVDHEILGITVPTLVVVGAEDAATPPAKAERIAARIPGAHLQIVANCGHTSPLEQPEMITGLLDTFLATVDRA
ncbi:alpha/beta fold hydrolase [Frankia sp. Cr1]|uniref:alpha/beta fold hydrolase n=1 Tax=Frankia sp. Cr1 TaxID=3073931 RepID=UPI002AD2C8F1|nr:alpha/beta fold hydrolase [Frankia sp. Cr1]